MFNKYQRGQDDAVLLRGDFFIKNNELKPAIRLLGTLRDSARVRFAITLANFYLARQNRTKADTDSSLAFLHDADKNARPLSEIESVYDQTIPDGKRLVIVMK